MKIDLVIAGMVCAGWGMILTQVTAVDGMVPKWVAIVNVVLLAGWAYLTYLGFTRKSP